VRMEGVPPGSARGHHHFHPLHSARNTVLLPKRKTVPVLGFTHQRANERPHWT